MPKRPIPHHNQQLSFTVFENKVGNHLGIIRRQTDNDYGVDFEFEFVDKQNVTGKIIKCQLKSTENIYIKKDDCPICRGIKQSTLEYWAEISKNINVIVFLVDLKTEKIYMTKPIRRQAHSLISDDPSKTKTISFLPYYFTDEIIPVLTKAFAYAPTGNEEKNCHKRAIDFLPALIEQLTWVVGSDPTSEFDMGIIRTFLDISKELLYYPKILGNEFAGKDAHNNKIGVRIWNENYWQNLLVSQWPNFWAKESFVFLFNLYVRELKMLKECMSKGEYYWKKNDPDYLYFVNNSFVPREIDLKACNDAWKLYEEYEAFLKNRD